MRYKTLIYILTFIASFCSYQVVWGQYSSVLNNFELDYIEGCEGLTVHVTYNIADPDLHDARFYTDGFKPGIDSFFRLTTFTYDEAGEYYLVLQLNEKTFGANSLDSILVKVFEPHVPTFTIHNCASHQVRVEITDEFYDNYSVKFTTTDSVDTAPLSFTNAFDYGTLGDYRVDVRGEFDDAPKTGLSGGCPSGNAGFTSIETIVEPVITSIRTEDNSMNGSLQIAHALGENSIYSISQSDNGRDSFVTLGNTDSFSETLLENLNTRDAYYCFQIDTYDACNDVTILSDIACSVNLEMEANDDGHKLTWDTDETIAQSYTITRNSNLLTEITDLSVKTYNDTAVICLQEYVYNVSANFGPAIATSQDMDIVAIQSGDLPAITSYPMSTVIDQEVYITWNAPSTGNIPFRNYLIERSINDRSWASIGVSEDTVFTDTDNNFTLEYSYRISYDDDCGNEALPSPLTTPIRLEQVGTRGKIVSYSWNRYDTWTEGIQNYTLERVDADGNVIEEYPVLSGRTKDIEFDVNDLDEKFIRVRAESLDPIALFSYSNIVDSRLSIEMFLPNAFTPDGDGLNDNLTAEGPAVDGFLMEIYNRWGIMIFSTTDLINGWDGIVNGDESPQDTYVYKIYFEDGAGEKHGQSGSFLLLRY